MVTKFSDAYMHHQLSYEYIYIYKQFQNLDKFKKQI